MEKLSYTTIIGKLFRLFYRIRFSISSFPLFLLQKFYKFDQWHTRPLLSKRYAQHIIRYCNKKITINSMAEIGCGLGHIIRNIRCRNKTGYDTDENVLRAAEFLSKFWKRGKIKFKKFTFPQDDLKMKYDLIIMVNWIHEINSSLLKQHIIKYYYNNLNHGGIIILDTVQDKNYMYNHQIDFLIENLSCSLHEIGNDIAQRKIYSIVKTP